MPVKKVDLPDWPWRAVLRLAEERRVQVWLVGGAVRDALLDRPVHDWDFAVDRDGLGLARAVADALGGAYFPLDAERETGRAILKAADGSRVELDFALLRGPDLEADLVARDFTINALALDQTNSLVDSTGGLADLEARRIRATSGRTFRDDPVRLLRAVRGEAALGFEIEPQTEAWLRRDAALLTEPSVERVRDEFVRTLMLPDAALHVQRIDDLGLLAHFLPEIESLKQTTQSWPHRFDVWRHTLHILDALEGVVTAATGQEVTPRPLTDPPPAAWGDVARVLGQFAGDIETHLAVEVSGGRDRWVVLKLAALLHDIGKPSTWSQDEDDGRIHFYNHDLVGAPIAAQRLQELRFSREEVERVRVMVGQHLRPAHLARADTITRRAVYRYFRATGCAGVDVVLLSLADHLSTWGPNLQEERWSRRLHAAETLLTHCFEQYEETVEPPALVTGHDLIEALGLGSGPQIGQLLETIREAQAAGEVRTQEEALALAQRISKSA
ncbi:MAG TPA: HD domain-containing protein [Chloroflexi bacterium]|nr:HD domain-containing protein [Chloroflexota bacterium]